MKDKYKSYTKIRSLATLLASLFNHDTIKHDSQERHVAGWQPFDSRHRVFSSPPLNLIWWSSNRCPGNCTQIRPC